MNPEHKSLQDLNRQVIDLSIEYQDYDQQVADRVAEAHAYANAYEDAGNPIMAGLLRVEAANIAQRPRDWKPIHKPNIGPYNAENPCHCINCGRPSNNALSYDFGDELNCDQKLLHE